jgi:hypothetical protein
VWVIGSNPIVGSVKSRFKQQQLLDFDFCFSDASPADASHRRFLSRQVTVAGDAEIIFFN